MVGHVNKQERIMEEVMYEIDATPLAQEGGGTRCGVVAEQVLIQTGTQWEDAVAPMHLEGTQPPKALVWSMRDKAMLSPLAS